MGQLLQNSMNKWVLLTLFLYVADKKLVESLQNPFTNGIYRSGRYPRTFHKVLLQQKPVYKDTAFIKPIKRVLFSTKKDNFQKKPAATTRNFKFSHVFGRARRQPYNVFGRIRMERNRVLGKTGWEPDLNWNRRRYMVHRDATATKKNEITKEILHSNHPVLEVPAQKRKFNKKIFNELKLQRFQLQYDPMDRNRKRYYVAPATDIKDPKRPIQVNASRKNEIINSKYYYEPLNNDLFPFIDHGKRHSLTTINENPQKELPSKDNAFSQNKVVEGANGKEVVFSSNANDETKQVEFYLTENNGDVKVSHGQEAEKLLRENGNKVDEYNPVKQQQKFNDNEQSDYINQVLGREDEEESAKVSIGGVPYPADDINGVHQTENQHYHPIIEQNGQSHPSFQSIHKHPQELPHLFQPIVEHHRQPSPLHETEGPVESVPVSAPVMQDQSYSVPIGKFTDVQPEEATYSDAQWQNHQKHLEQNDQAEQSLPEKIKSFNNLMGKLHRNVQNDHPDEHEIDNSLHSEHMDWQNNPSHLHSDRYLPNHPQIGSEFYQHSPMNQHISERYEAWESGANRHEIGHEQHTPTEYGLNQLNQGNHRIAFSEHRPFDGHNDFARFRTAMKLSKAIINSARNVDNPSYDPQYDININGQTLIPEVFEAFSKTNNDLKKRYNSLQRWAISKSATATEHQLRQEITNLNELSDMVHLVNNLEKDMLKTILKKKRVYGEEMSYKHEVIPNVKDDSESNRFHSPSDVHDLLQYIYDTYIENRTADEIPVVLQAFQKSVTDIVAKKNITLTNSTTAAGSQNVSKESALISKSLDMLSKQADKTGGVGGGGGGIGSYNLDDDALSNFDFEDHSTRQGFFGDRVVNAALRDHTTKGDVEGKDDRKLTKFVDKGNNLNSPLITVKLLKALDLFLDSIEIGRRIKKFRTKVEDVARTSNHSVSFTSSMKQSLGQLNKEINDTLERSIGFTKKESKDPQLEAEEHKHFVKPLNNTIHKDILHSIHTGATSKDELESRSEESYKDKLDELRKALHGDIAEDYNGKAYDENGIYYEKHKDDPNYLSYEKEWYTNNTFPNKEKYVFNPNMNLENFTASVNHTAVYVDPHSPYEHIPDLHHEESHHDITQGSFNEKNITKLNKEALKGQEAINETVPYDKLLKVHNDTLYESLHSWNAENMTQLNKEAAKGQKYYHDQASNDTNNFDKDVQKIIDSAINEAKNGSVVDSFYQTDKDTKDYFGEAKIGKKIETSRLEMNTMFNALDKANTNVNDQLSKHQIDKETKNATETYLAQEGRYINNLFYEENKPYIQHKQSDEGNSYKKDFTGQNESNSYPKKENFVIQGEWDKRNMDFLDKSKVDDIDISPIENIKQIVRHLQSQNTNNETKKSSDATKSKMDTIEKDSNVNKVSLVMENIKNIEKDFFVTKNSTEINDSSNKVTSKTNSLLNVTADDKHSADKKTVTSSLHQSTSKMGNDFLPEDIISSEENDYVIKEQEKRAKQLRQENNEKAFLSNLGEELRNGLAVKAISSASNFNELERAINEIKGDKKTLDLVDKVVEVPKAEPMKVGEFDKRNMKTDDHGLGKAHKLMEEINSISYVDDDDDSKHVASNVRRSNIVKTEKKRGSYNKKRIQKRNINQSLEKRKTKERNIDKNIKQIRYKKHKKHKGNWRRKEPRKGTKKTEIESKNIAMKESFIDKLSESQQKMVWHILKRAYHKGQEDQNTTLKTTIEDNSQKSSEDEHAQDTLNDLLQKFLTEKPSNVENSSNLTSDPDLDEVKVGNNSTTNNISFSNDNIIFNYSSVDPYSTIRKIFKLKNDSVISGGDVYPAVSYLQGSTTNSDDKGTQLSTLLSSSNNPAIVNGGNKTLQFSNEDSTSQNKPSENYASYEKEGTDTFFFRNKEKSRNLMAKNTLHKVGNNTGLNNDGPHQLPSIMQHLDKVAKQMNNESAELIKPFKNSSSNLTDDQSSESSNSDNEQTPDPIKPLENNQILEPTAAILQTSESSNYPCKRENKVITDGDDIFNLSTDQCVDDTKNEEEKKNISNDTENCIQHFLTFKKNGFTFKVPTLKCPKSENGIDSTDVLHMSDLIADNTSFGRIEKSNDTKGYSNNSMENCDPMYKTLVDGETEYKIKVGCKKEIQYFLGTDQNKENKSEKSYSVKGKNATVDVIQIATPRRNEKVVYKGKNLMMTQDDIGSEKIMINGSNRMIEISYPPEDVLDGFITLKQGSRLYKIPYKNHNNIEPVEQLPGKSKISSKPDYLKSAMTNTETFKVKDTAITKSAYRNGAKVITMEKEKASLSIYYPPKNKTKMFNDSGYMVLKENGKTYNIPLDGNKTLKQIGNNTFLSSKAFRNEENTDVKYTDNTSPIAVNTGNKSYTLPATVKEVDIFNGKNGESSMKVTPGRSPKQVHLAEPDDTLTDETNHFSSNNDIMRIKERRFKKEYDFHYQPKAYKADTFRHQKHFIEDEPRYSSRYREKDERDEADPNEEEREEELRREHDDIDDDHNRNDDDDAETSEGPNDGRLHGDTPNHVEVFPTIPAKGVDLQEFLGGAYHQDITPPTLQEFADTDRQQDRTPSIENENQENGVLSRFLPPPSNEDSEQEIPTDKDNEEQNTLPPNEPGVEQEIPQVDYPQEVTNNHAIAQTDQIDNNQPPEELEQRKPLQDDENDNDQNFFPLKEKLIAPQGYKADEIKKLPILPSIITQPQFIPGGSGLQNHINPSPFGEKPSKDRNMFVAGLRNGQNENVRITTISGSMNPDINERNRLEDFSTYAMGRSIKGSHKKKKNLDDKKMKQFVTDVLSSKKAQQFMLPPSYNQLPFLRKVQDTSMKHIGAVFNHLQNDALRQYTNPSNDKLDRTDKTQLKRLGYTSSEFYKINKQIVGRKRANLNNVGIMVNGQKMGNTNLLLKTIPHVQG